MSPGDFVLVMGLFMQLAAPMDMMGTVIRELEQSGIDSEDLQVIMKIQNSIKEKPDARELDFKGGAVKFDGVGFQFPS